MNNRLTAAQQQALLAKAAQGMGIPPDELLRRLQTGNLASLAPGDPRVKQLSAILSDRQAAEKLMTSPQVKALLEALMRDAPKKP